MTIVKENKMYMGLFIRRICVEERIKIKNLKDYTSWLEKKAYAFEEEWDISKESKEYLKDIRAYIENEFRAYINS